MLDIRDIREITEEWVPPNRVAPFEKNNLIIGNFQGEFGWFVIKHIRYCYTLKKKYIVCCRRGEETLFPRASGFFYDWADTLPDEHKAGLGSKKYAAKLRRADTVLERRLAIKYPEYSFVRPEYKNGWRTINIKFPVTVKKHFSNVDIVIAPRWRLMAANRNLNWDKVIEKYGPRIHLAGAKNSSKDYGLPANKAAWQHPDGPCAGTIDLLQQCRVYLGGDSGVSHLGAFLNREMIIVRNGNMTGLMKSDKPVHIVDNIEQLLERMKSYE
jgi:hypothetical protein